MKKLLLFVFLVFAVQTILNAQVPRRILVEYFTNASCPPCASSNPGTHEHISENYDKVNTVWYHAWWPGVDPMYDENVDENVNRINFYGINGVPAYVVDGKYQGYADNFEGFKNNINREAGLETPVELNVSHSIENDSIIVNVDLYLHSDLSVDQLKLRTTVTEKSCYYMQDPGTNGENFFPDVFRKFCGSPSGIDITSLEIAKHHQYRFAERLESHWDADSLAAVAWVQSDASKYVYQSASDRYFFKINEDGAGSAITAHDKKHTVQLNSDITQNLYLENVNNETLNVSIVLNRKINYDNWDIMLKYNETELDSFDLSIAPGEKEYFDLIIASGELPSVVNLKIDATEKGENTRHKYQYNYYAVVKQGDIVLFDEDPSGPFAANYHRVLNQLEVPYSKIPYEIYPEIDDMDIVNSNSTLIWNLGNNLPMIEQSGIMLTQEILDQGGRAIIAGQNIGYDLMELKRNSISRFFYRLYLDANFIEDSSDIFSIESVEGNGVLEGFEFDIAPVYDMSLDVISQYQGNSIPVLQYAGTNNPAMLLHEKNDYKVAYMTFGLEQIPDEALQETLVEKVLEWFNNPTDVTENSNGIPSQYSLEQNYPNPFNPSTVINYKLADAAEVRLSVYNALGEEVALLENGYKNAGHYSVKFNAADLGSGIYFYEISANGFHQVRKMLLLK
jgi:hypothetical protein